MTAVCAGKTVRSLEKACHTIGAIQIVGYHRQFSILCWFVRQRDWTCTNQYLRRAAYFPLDLATITLDVCHAMRLSESLFVMKSLGLPCVCRLKQQPTEHYFSRISRLALPASFYIPTPFYNNKQPIGCDVQLEFGSNCPANCLGEFSEWKCLWKCLVGFIREGNFRVFSTGNVVGNCPGLESVSPALKSLRAADMICSILINTQTHTDSFRVVVL